MFSIGMANTGAWRLSPEGSWISRRGSFRINPLEPLGQKSAAAAFEVREIIAGIFRGLGDIQREIIYRAPLEAYRRRGFKNR